MLYRMGSEDVGIAPRLEFEDEITREWESWVEGEDQNTRVWLAYSSPISRAFAFWECLAAGIEMIGRLVSFYRGKMVFSVQINEIIPNGWESPEIRERVGKRHHTDNWK